ncbi:MAG: metal-dependent hydrolase [Bacteroidales bacterium]|nr:metal-dependent hydrolase [Bacteroidales bacterium]
MDSLTQAILGAAVAEAAIGKKEGNKAVWWGAAIGTLPDLDVFVARFFDPVRSLLFHRGISHSLLFMILVSPLIGLVLKKIYSKSATTLKQWGFMAFLVLATHVLLDLFTTYGTGIFEPFSNMRIEWSTIAIIDPFYTVPLLLSLIVILFLKRDKRIRRIAGIAGLTISTVYLMLTVVNKFHINHVFKSQLAAQGIEYSQLKTTPLPLSNFLWMGLARYDDGHYLGLYSLYDTSGFIEFEEIKRNDFLIYHLLKDKRIRNLTRFSKNYYSVKFVNGNLLYSDLRFGRMGFEKHSPFIFSFTISHDGEKLSIKETEMPGRMPEDFFSRFIKRIFGHIDQADNTGEITQPHLP